MEIFEDLFDDFGYILGGTGEDIAVTLTVALVVYFGALIFLGIVWPIMLHNKAKAEGKISKGCAYLLLLMWTPVAAHRFYVNKGGSAVLWWFTGAYFGFGPLIDLFGLSGLVDKYNADVEQQRMVQKNNEMMQQNMQMQSNMMMQMNNQMMQGQPDMQQAQGIPMQQTPQVQQQVASAPMQQQVVTPQQVVEPSVQVQPYLIGIAGQYAGLDIPVDSSGVILGRDPSVSHVVFENTDFSRRHCVIKSVDKGFVLTDYSSNGTFLSNGIQLVKGQDYNLNDGDMFYLVDSKETFKVIMK